MIKNITIEIPKSDEYCHEIRNELTKFLDEYRVKELKSLDNDYAEFNTTYIHVDKIDIQDLLSSSNNSQYLLFRIVGASRGSFVLKEISRNIKNIYPVSHSKDDKPEIKITIEYEISDIEFIESSCFDKLHAYNREIIDASKVHIVGTKITLIIHQ